MRIMIINGPNLNMLGIREPHIYGTTTLDAIKSVCEEFAHVSGAQLSFHQSNHEGVMVDLIQSARTEADAIIINPAAYSFTSVAIFDALKIFEGPIYEVHISNIHARDGGAAIVAGNERVLRARFADAKFFWDLDRKIALDDLVPKLADVVFHAKLGSVADKTARMEKLAGKLAAFVPGGDAMLASRAAQLSKADLVSGMVGEFAELAPGLRPKTSLLENGTGQRGRVPGGAQATDTAHHVGRRVDVADLVEKSQPVRGQQLPQRGDVHGPTLPGLALALIDCQPSPIVVLALSEGVCQMKSSERGHTCRSPSSRSRIASSSARSTPSRSPRPVW